MVDNMELTGIQKQSYVTILDTGHCWRFVVAQATRVFPVYSLRYDNGIEQVDGS